ncbi:MAG TPA: hypothetical protein VLB80_04675 [Candidatus Babeliales bacterium]|nr:hypothetical protein [Candidatus Babeliales bacterium]
MKNVHILPCLLLINFTLHCMEKVEPWKEINHVTIEESLKNDCEKYLINRLEEYKTTHFTPADMDNMQKTCHLITGMKNEISTIRPLLNNSVRDGNWKKFLHITVQKKDEDIVTWLLNNECYTIKSDLNYKYPLDLCINQLLPSVHNARLSAAYRIFNLLTIPAYLNKFSSVDKKKFLQSTLLLQFKHLQALSDFRLDDNAFKRFLIGKTDDQKDIILADSYRDISDENGNNFTHILVQHHKSDELYEFIQKKYVSPAKNKDDKTPVDLALTLFQNFTQNPSSINPPSDIFNKARCCLFMLLNYAKLQNKVTNFEQCCTVHTIT